MAKFDTKTFLELTGKGTSPIGALGTSFGMPSCMVNLASEAGGALLNLLPSPVLRAVRSSTANGAARADDVTKALSAKLRAFTGIIEYDTEDGIFRFVSDSSRNGLDSDEGGVLNALGGFLAAAGAVAGFAGKMYTNYQSTVAQINSISDCIKSFKEYLDYTGGNAGDRKAELAALDPDAYQALLDSQFGSDVAYMEDAINFKLKAENQLRAIDSVLSARRKDPSLEPEFTSDYADLVNGAGLKIETEPTVVTEEVFRLDYGPPLSKSGRFVLSIDGLFYDSQTSGIVPALLEIESRKEEIPTGNLWSLEQDPNLGGRGIPTTISDLQYYVNTILDPNIIDDSNPLLRFYNQDNIYLDLVGQKNRKIFDVSSNLAGIEASGGSEALIANLRQVMLSEASHFIHKINKRKKQIELAVKIPVLYGKGSIYEPGQIPVNDFSYLEGINFLVDIEKQRSITINQADVEGVVLPLEVKYTKQIDSVDPIVFDHLLINTIASGTIVSNPSGLSGPSISVNQAVVGEGLFAMYNYLTLSSTQASSTNYRLHNSSSKGIDYNAKLVGQTSSILDLGVGIAYFDGVAKVNPNDTSEVSALGSFAVLPEKREFQDFLYSRNGATFETWIHMPELDGQYYGFNTDADTFGLYRLILANENTGSTSSTASQDDITRLRRDNSSSNVRGLIFGFTRDRRFTQGAEPSNAEDDNRVERACLVLAPTQSFDSSSVGFIHNNLIDCNTLNSWHGMSIHTSSVINNKSLSTCGLEFCQLALTFNPNRNKISIYFDGTLLATSSYQDVFGVNPMVDMPNIPSFKKLNSFDYAEANLASACADSVKNSLRTGSYFTPWILGGGFTDGNPNGNFMGGEYGGTISGLKGYLGATKFYNRPLEPHEVLNNFDATKNFFKNIDVPNLMWEPIL